MGDISEYRGLLVAITFMGIFAFLLLAIPTQFITDPEAREVSYPDNWDSTELLYIAETYNYTTLGTTTDEDFEMGGRTQNLEGYGSPYNGTMLKYVWYDWIIFRSEEPCIWYNEQGEIVNTDHQHVLDTAQLDEEYDTDDRFIAKFPEAGFYQMYVIFSYDNGSYDGFEDAFYNDALGFWCGIQFDQINTSYNAWDVIALLLFFQMPDVHWAINALIAIPLWIVIVYVSFIVILRVIGAVFGGGGA